MPGHARFPRGGARLVGVAGALVLTALFLLPIIVGAPGVARAPRPLEAGTTPISRGTPTYREVSAAARAAPPDLTSSEPFFAPGLERASDSDPAPVAPSPGAPGDEPLVAPSPLVDRTMSPASVLRPPDGPAIGPANLTLTGSMGLIVAQNRTVGSISISGNATLYVHNATGPVTLTVLGDISVSQYGLLFLNRSTLFIDESYDVEWDIVTSGNARFVAVGSNLTTNGFQVGAEYEGMSNVTVWTSLFCSPSGWIDTDLVEGATLVVLYSSYSSDVILFDVPYLPSKTNFTAAYAVGFNVWLDFGAGATANVSLPGPDAYENWTFPGASNVTGLDYSVTLDDSYVVLFAILLGQGANLTVRNSPNVVLSFDSAVGTLDLVGLQQTHYAHFGYRADAFDLTLSNSTVFTWNAYGLGGNLSISDSQVGEIQVYGAAWAVAHGDELTGDGGYYGNQGSGEFGIYNSTIASQVVGYSGSTVLENCTVDTPVPSWVLAAGTGTVSLVDTVLSGNDSLLARAGGTINVYWTTQLNVTHAGLPAAGATLNITYQENDSVAQRGTTNASGLWSGPLLGETVLGNGTESNNFSAQASWGEDVGQVPVPAPTGPGSVALGLVPLIASTDPADGATNVSVEPANLGIAFTLPMDPLPTMDAFAIRPSASYLFQWDLTDDYLSIAFVAPLSANTTYAWTLNDSARTQTGLVPQAPFGANFTTGGPPTPPTVIGEVPGNGSSGVSLWANLSVAFDEPMDDSSLIASFSLGPGAPSGVVSSNGTAVFWRPTAPFSPGTRYTLTISTAARSASGAALAHPFVLEFTTETPVSITPPVVHGTGGPPPGPSTDLDLGVAAVVLLLAVGVVALYVVRRRRRGPDASGPTPSRDATEAPAWSEDPPKPPPTG